MRCDLAKARPRVEWSDTCGQWVVRFHHKQQNHGRTVILAIMGRHHSRKAQMTACQYLGCQSKDVEVIKTT